MEYKNKCIHIEYSYKNKSSFINEDIYSIQQYFKENNINSELYKLNDLHDDIKDDINLLIIRNGINIITENNDYSNILFSNVDKLKWNEYKCSSKKNKNELLKNNKFNSIEIKLKDEIIEDGDKNYNVYDLKNLQYLDVLKNINKYFRTIYSYNNFEIKGSSFKSNNNDIKYNKNMTKTIFVYTGDNIKNNFNWFEGTKKVGKELNIELKNGDIYLFSNLNIKKYSLKNNFKILNKETRDITSNISVVPKDNKDDDDDDDIIKLFNKLGNLLELYNKDRRKELLYLEELKLRYNKLKKEEIRTLNSINKKEIEIQTKLKNIQELKRELIKIN